MLGNAAEASQRQVWARPSIKAWRNCRDHVLQRREVLVVNAAAADQFPHPLDGIEFRTVGRQKVELEVAANLFPPSLVQAGVVIAGIVDDHDHLAARCSGDALDSSVEGPAGAGVKHALGLGHDELAIPQSDRPKLTDALARRGVEADRIVYLRGHPHAAARAVLLKLNFIHGPEIKIGSGFQNAEFFGVRLGVRGPLWQLVGVACATESPTAETAADTAGLSVSLRGAGPDKPRAWGRPTLGSAIPAATDWNAGPLRLEPSGDRSTGWDARGAALRTNRPTRGSRNVEPSLRRCETNRPTDQPPADRSFLERRAKRHGGDDRIAKYRCAGFRPGEP